jgi:hypothetical protein
MKSGALTSAMSGTHVHRFTPETIDSASLERH